MTNSITSSEGEPDWRAIRKRYENLGLPMSEVAAGTGMAWQKIAGYAARHGWEMRKPRTPKQKVEAVRDVALMPTRLATRLKRLIAREIEALESECTDERPALERERDARRLSSLVRSLEKLNDIKAAKTKRDDKKDGDSLYAPGSDAEMRAELERRLARFAAGDTESGLSGEPERGGESLAD